MKNLQKVLCLVLAMVMMLSVMIVGAGAVKTFPDQKDIQNVEAVNMAVALNIIQGRDTGEFDPTGNITRAEMAKMICVLWNGGNEPKLGTTTQANYTDISGHWAEKYIEYCSALGFVAGRGDGTFDPWGNVTGTEAAKMMLVTLGFDPVAEGFNGLNWSTKIDTQASTKGLYDDMTSSFSPSSPLSRDDAAQMLWNALQTYCVSYDSELQMVNGQLQTVKVLKDKTGINGNTSFFITLLYDRYDKAVQEEAILESFTYDSNKEEWTYIATDRDGNSLGKFTSEQDFTYLYKQNVKVVFNYKSNSSSAVDNFYGMFADESVVLAEGIVGDLDNVKANSKDIKIDSTSYKLEKNADQIDVFYFVNGGTDQVMKLDKFYNDLDNAEPFTMKAVDNDNNNKVDFFVVQPFAVAQIDYMGAKNFTTTYYSKVDNTTSATDGEVKGLLTGSIKLEDVTYFDGMAKDNFVVFTPAQYTANDEDTYTKVDTVLKGDVKSTTSDKISVDGTWYNVLSDVDTSNDVSAGGKISDAPVVNGYVFTVDGTGSVSVDDYALVIGYSLPASGNTLDSYRVKLLFADGTKKTVDVDDEDADASKTAGVPNSSITSKGSYDTVLGAQLADLYKSGNAGKGTLVTYDTNSDDEYQLTIAEVSGGDADKAGFDSILNPGAGTNGFTGTGSKVKYIDGANIDDGAVIFLNDDGSFKTITGAKLKALAKSSLKVVNAYADEDSSSGYNTVKLAFLATTGSGVTTADRSYGYVVKAPATDKIDGTNLYTYTIWNGGPDPIEVSTKNRATVFGSVVKGDVISYTLNDDDRIDDLTILTSTGDKTATKFHEDGATAITGWDGTYVTTTATNNGTQAYDRLEITKDTVIFYVDVDEVEGIANADTGVIQKAAEKPGSGYFENAVVVANDAKDEVDFILIEASNDIYLAQ